MQIVILLFDGITALDAIGPYEVLSRIPNSQVRFVAHKAGSVRTDNGMLGLVADSSVTEVDKADILLIPGGRGSRALEDDQELLTWIRNIDATTQWTTSVCTGSLILAAAGLLQGCRATTHWARIGRLSQFGAIPVSQRVVEEGTIMTAAGVSAGIDMALTLVSKLGGEPLARAIQLGIEYDPAPPFVGGSVKTTPEAIVTMVRGLID